MKVTWIPCLCGCVLLLFFFVAIPAVLSARLVEERVTDLCRLHIDSVETWRKRDATLSLKPSVWRNQCCLFPFRFVWFFLLCPGHGEAAAACCAGLLRGRKQRSMMQLFRGIQRFPFFFLQMKPARNAVVVPSYTFPCRERTDMQQWRFYVSGEHVHERHELNTLASSI